MRAVPALPAHQEFDLNSFYLQKSTQLLAADWSRRRV